MNPNQANYNTISGIIIRDKALERKISNQNLTEFGRQHAVSDLALNNAGHSADDSDSGHDTNKSSNGLGGGKEINNNNNSNDQPPKNDPIRMKLISEVDKVKTKITKQFPKLSGEHNVLVIGAHDVGKSSLINSLWLSMTGETEERSPPVGKPYNFAAVPIYRRRSQYSRNGGIRINGGSLQFWDTRGFHKIHSVSLLATLFRFILEGRMPSAYFHQALMLQEQVIIKNCKKIEINRNKIYKAIVFIERENPTEEMEEQTQKLAQALKMGLARSKFHAVKNIPVIRVKNGAEKEVRGLGKSMTSVSSVESLNEVGMPGRQHNIESYTWSVNYTDYDLDEIDTDEDLEYVTKSNAERCDAEQNYEHDSGTGENSNENSEAINIKIGSTSKSSNNDDNTNTDINNNNIETNANKNNNQAKIPQIKNNSKTTFQISQINETPNENQNQNENHQNEIDEDDEEPQENNNFYLKMNIKPSNRFEFSYRLGPDEHEITPEKHLSLLLFLSNLLTIMVYPDGNESKKWRMDKSAVSVSDRQIGCSKVFSLFAKNGKNNARYKCARN